MVVEHIVCICRVSQSAWLYWLDDCRAMLLLVIVWEINNNKPYSTKLRRPFCNQLMSLQRLYSIIQLRRTHKKRILTNTKEQHLWGFLKRIVNPFDSFTITYNCSFVIVIGWYLCYVILYFNIQLTYLNVYEQGLYLSQSQCDRSFFGHEFFQTFHYGLEMVRRNGRVRTLKYRTWRTVADRERMNKAIAFYWQM